MKSFYLFFTLAFFIGTTRQHTIHLQSLQQLSQEQDPLADLSDGFFQEISDDFNSRYNEEQSIDHSQLLQQSILSVLDQVLIEQISVDFEVNDNEADLYEVPEADLMNMEDEDYISKEELEEIYRFLEPIFNSDIKNQASALLAGSPISKISDEDWNALVEKTVELIKESKLENNDLAKFPTSIILNALLELDNKIDTDIDSLDFGGRQEFLMMTEDHINLEQDVVIAEASSVGQVGELGRSLKVTILGLIVINTVTILALVIYNSMKKKQEKTEQVEEEDNQYVAMDV